MRCEDCLPLIEEYFDGELDARTSEHMSAHLATCADCAAALDSLSFEQEIYARYDRPVEVAPSLWASVSAEIARGAQPEQHPAPRKKFLSRLREGFTVSLAALALRPALASTLALLVVAAAAGSLWLAHVRSTVAPSVRPDAETAVITPKGNTGGVSPSPIVNTTGGDKPAVDSPKVGEGGRSVVGRAAVPREPNAHVERAGLTAEDVKNLIDGQPQSNSLANGTVRFEAVNQAKPEDDPLAEPQTPNSKVVATSARLLDPEQKELALHVEQAQILLRSIKNARPSDGDTVNVSYEKKLSRKLLAENATLQLDAETRGDHDTQQVLDSIEPFLLDIANMHDDASREEVRSVKERVKRTEIIAALQVY